MLFYFVEIHNNNKINNTIIHLISGAFHSLIIWTIISLCICIHSSFTFLW